MNTRAMRTWLAFVALAVAASCRTDLPAINPAPAPEPVVKTIPTGCERCPLPSDYQGIWMLMNHEIPGIAAMSDADAQKMRGRIIRLLPNDAVSGSERCAVPTYAVRQTTAQELTEAYRARPNTLRDVDWALRPLLVDVSCPGGRFSAPGSRVILLHRDHALTVWDGVFFHMMRIRDRRAVGQEPFWSLEIAQGKEMRFTYDAGERVVVMPYAHPAPVPGDDRPMSRQYHAVADYHDLQVIFSLGNCSDVMSGKSFDEIVTVTLDGQVFKGCGERVDRP